MIALGILGIVAVDFWVASPRQGAFLELDGVGSTAASRMQVYFDQGSGYQEADSFIDPVAAGSGSQRLLFPLPGAVPCAPSGWIR